MMLLWSNRIRFHLKFNIKANLMETDLDENKKRNKVKEASNWSIYFD